MIIPKNTFVKQKEKDFLISFSNLYKRYITYNISYGGKVKNVTLFLFITTLIVPSFWVLK